MRIPSTAALPLTVTRPARIQASASRREPSPSCDSTFCRRSAALTTGMLPLAGIVGRRGDQTRNGPRGGAELLRLARLGVASFLVELIAGGGCGRLAGRGRAVGLRGYRQIELRIELAERVQLAERRQLVQALQSEVLQKFAGGTKQLRPARPVTVADHPDPLPLQQRLGDV